MPFFPYMQYLQVVTYSNSSFSSHEKLVVQKGKYWKTILCGSLSFLLILWAETLMFSLEEQIFKDICILENLGRQSSVSLPSGAGFFSTVQYNKEIIPTRAYVACDLFQRLRFLSSRSLHSNGNPSLLCLGLLAYGPHGTWGAQRAV